MTNEEILLQRGYLLMEIDRLHSPAQPIEANYSIFAFCDGGEATLEINMSTVVLRAGDRLYLPNVLLSKVNSVSEDFHARVLIITSRFAIDTSLGIPTPMLVALMQNPLHHLANDEQALMTHLLDIIRIYENLPTATRQVEVVGTTVRTILVIMGEQAMASAGAKVNISYSNTDTYFRNFVSLIDQEVKRQHDVKYYADRLHITPKYLSDVTRKKSGFKAKDVISSILIAKLKREILLTGKSMKEISAEFGFADQSSLGKFFHKAVGVSPLAFKQSNGKLPAEK